MGSFEDSQASARRFSHDHYPSDQLIEARAKVDRADEDENLRVYNEERHRLVKAERSNRFDDTKRKQRTPEECKADEKIRHLKSLERKDIYGKEDDDGIFKGASWATVKSRGAHKGKLYDIVKKVRCSGEEKRRIDECLYRCPKAQCSTAIWMVPWMQTG